jgi:hypothetical protein
VVSVVFGEVPEDAVVSTPGRGISPPIGGEIPLPSHFRPRTFRREVAVYTDNRREVVIRYGPLALSGQPMITRHWGPVLLAPGHRVPPVAIMGHVASVCMIIRVYSKTLVLWPTTRNARAGSQSTIHPKLTERRRARATYRTHGPRRADRNSWCEGHTSGPALPWTVLP